MTVPSAAPTGPVEIVGTGLVGTSIALACRRAGVEVLLTDVSSEHVRTASGLGAGRPRVAADRPQLVVVAVPPDRLGEEIVSALTAGDAVVTDVGSIKSQPLAHVLAAVDEHEAARYVGSHPMAGSERSGPLAASASLFDGRPWAVVPHAAAAPSATALVRGLAELCGAVPLELEAAEHDRAVARTSHLPHLAAVLVAGRLAGVPPRDLALSGQGVRDVTRIAGSDPSLWEQIVSANAPAVLEVLGEVREQLDVLIAAVDAGERTALHDVLARGVRGTQAIPGKHGAPTRPMVAVFVAVPDHPGELARLFADAGASEVNIEDVRIDHDPGREVGQVELLVDEGRSQHLLDTLESRGWLTHR
ncbi:prephenate dehydrogenase [Nocardioides houyundeii]|uniref:prephenate dehydrogenase n=1 Tax=Nocardioides houyundeii TaxID=2045452 RepID=UPI000DF3852E|nr:prephenate dehydrogenase [Nocardioides houyundeii]